MGYMSREWKVGSVSGENGIEFHVWLKKRMDELGLRVDDVARAVGAGTDAVRKWRSGITGQPNQKYIVPLSHVLQASANDIRRMVGYPETITDNRPSTPDLGLVAVAQVSRGGDVSVVPVLGTVPSQLAHDGKGEGVLMVPSSLVEGYSDVVAVRVDDDCLINRDVYEGDYLLIDPGAVPYEGSVVVVEIEGELLAREWWPEDGLVILRPAGPGLRPERVDANEVDVRGVVRGAHRYLSLE